MQSKSARYFLLSWASAVLIALSVVHTAARAQVNPKSFQIISAGSAGFAPGQKLRYTWTNLSDSDPQQRDIGPQHVSVRLLSAEGRVIAQDQAAAVGAGKFQIFEFHRDQITLPGEPNTGRLQVRLEATVSGNPKWNDIVLKRGADTFDDALEIVDARGGTAASSKPKEIVVVGTPIPPMPVPGGWIDLGSGTAGIVPTQMLRVSVLNPVPQAVGNGQRFKMLFAITIYDADGRAIARGNQTVLDPGEFRWFDFKYAELAQRGEPGTGRLQVRVEIEQRFFPGITARISLGNVPAVLELVDGSTGTTTLLLPAIQKFRDPLPRRVN